MYVDTRQAKFEFLPFLKINFEVDSSESCIKKMYTSKSRHQKTLAFSGWLTVSLKTQTGRWFSLKQQKNCILFI